MCTQWCLILSPCSGGMRSLRSSDKENARPAQVTLTQTTQQQLQILLSAADSDSEENGDEPELNNRLSKFFICKTVISIF